MSIDSEILSQILAIYDSIMVIVLLFVSQIVTRAAGFHGEFRLRSLFRRCIYFVVMLVLCYRSYSLIESHWEVTISGAVSNAIMIFAIVLLSIEDAFWERSVRDRAQAQENKQHG